MAVRFNERTAHGDVSLVSMSQADTADAQQRRDSVADILTLAKARFKMVVEAESTLRTEQDEDLRFVSSDQWPSDIETSRSEEGRPCLTINRLPQFIRQVTNQQRASRPAIQVNPKSGGANLKTAEILQGVVRDIELESDAEVAYITGAEAQAKIGRGFWRVVTQYSDDPTSFQQVLRIKRIRNPFTVYMDPTTQAVDASDAKFCFIVEDMTKEAFAARFGEREDFGSLSDFTSIGDQAPVWLPNGNIRVAEYWYVVEDVEQLLDIEIAANPLIPGMQEPKRIKVVKSSVDLSLMPEHKIIRTRERKIQKVKMAVINAVGILEGNETRTDGLDWPGRWIPIIPVIGEEIDMNGRIDYRGMVRDAREPQRAYNFWISAATEAVALAPKAPWVMAFGQDEGFETMWDQSNVKNFSRLIYRPVDANGQLAPPPARQSVEPAIQAIVSLISQADNDLKATMGFYDASLGSAGPEQSGKAILARQKQGEIGNSNYLDNLGRAIKHTGRILVDLIPKTMEESQIVRIIDPNDKPKLVFHTPGAALEEGQDLPEGVDEQDIYDLTQGQYDVSISTGPSWQSKRQEAVAQMGELIQSNPALAQVIGDLWVGNMDSPWAQEAAKRLKKTVPPNLLDEGDGGEPQVPPEVQQQMEQMGQQMEQMAAALEDAQKSLAAKKDQMAAQTAIGATKAQADVQRAEIEATSRQEVERMRGISEMQQAQAKIDNERLMAQLKAETAKAVVEMKAENAMMIKRMEHAFGVRNDADDAMRAAIDAEPDPLPPGPVGV